ncbi:hypothetical protein Trco_001863 [Trichoderma cornu-damae]|uniref:Amidoligase enzyme n=1 Tax=Trichoderma cornu-damae TaxID=654480 RepID=A0A9P8QTZ8_9HYPO|nr:hypothetical protein Trco_001863 [Trichoderma cornu-damae]
MPGASSKPTRPRLEIITFGWEMEVLLRTKEEETVGGIDLTDQKLREFASDIAALVPDLPVAAECSHVPSKTCAVCKDASSEFRSTGLRVFTPAKPMFQPEGGVSEYLYFFFMSEFVSTPKAKAGEAAAYCFEIASPILDSRELEAGLPRTAKIVSALRNSKLGITAHTGCGLHFHVGVKSGMTLDIAKKVCTLIMLLEVPLLTAFCPPERISDHYFMPIHRTSWYADDAKAKRHDTASKTPTRELLEHFSVPLERLKPADWNDGNPKRWYTTLNSIWKAKDMCELSNKLCASIGEKSSLFLCVRDESGILQSYIAPDEDSSKFEGTPSTLEFRYPPMSFDIEYVKHWAEIASQVVQTASCGAPAFRQAAANILQELQRDGKEVGSPMWARLLTLLGLGHQIEYWKQQLPRFAAGEPIRFLGSDGFVLPDKQNSR